MAEAGSPILHKDGIWKASSSLQRTPLRSSEARRAESTTEVSERDSQNTEGGRDFYEFVKMHCKHHSRIRGRPKQEDATFMSSSKCTVNITHELEDGRRAIPDVRR